MDQELKPPPPPAGLFVGTSQQTLFWIRWAHARNRGRAYSWEQFAFEQAHENASREFETRTNVGLAKSDSDRPTSDAARRAEIRSNWLNAKLGDRSDLDLVAMGGPAYNTIQDWRSGKETTRKRYIQGKLAKALSCEISEVPE